MRVLLLWPAADFSVSDVASGLRAGLIENGHEVFDYRLGNRLHGARWALMREKAAMQSEPLDMLEAILWASEGLPFQALMHQVDWVIGVHGPGFHPAALVALRRAGIKIAWWFTEAPYESANREIFCLAEHVDVAFVNERSAVPLFQKALDEQHPGGSAHYLRHAYNPTVHFPRDGADLTPEERCDVLLIGTGFAERQHLFESCDWSGIDLALGGAWAGIYANYDIFKHLKHPPMQNPDTVRLYAGAKIILNCHRDAEYAESANPRVWEAAACGAFQVSDYRQEIADVLGDAVPMYRAGVPWDFITLVRRWLRDDAGRDQHAAAALERVQGQTFTERTRTIVEVLTEYERGAQRRPAVSAPAMATA